MEETIKKQSNLLATASLITGILGFISCCAPPLQFFLGVAGILLVIFSKKGKPMHPCAVAGLVLSILSLIISIAMVAYMVILYNIMKDPSLNPELYQLINEYMRQYESLFGTAP